MEYPNRGRQRELDFAKGLTIIFMVLVHTTEYYCNGNNVAYEDFMEFIGSPPGAPVFMALLGIGIVYSRHNSPKELAKRGVFMFALSYVFNIMVYAMPYLLNYLFYRDPSDLSYAMTEFLDADILQFAGLTFLFFALIRKWNCSGGQLAVTVVLLQAVNSLLLLHVEIENVYLESLAGVLFGAGGDSYFPFFSWIAFPVLGYLFGERLIRCTDKAAFYKKCIVIGGSVYVCGYIAAYRWGIEYGAFGALYQEAFYHMDICGNVILGSFVLLWLGMCYFVSEHLPQMVHRQMARWSKNLTVMYCTQYILIIYLQVFFFGEDTTFNAPQTFILACGMFALTDLVSFGYLRARGYVRQKQMQHVEMKRGTAQ